MHKNLIFALAAAEALLMFSELAKTNQVRSLKPSRLPHRTTSAKCYCKSKQNRSLIPSNNVLLITCNFK